MHEARGTFHFFIHPRCTREHDVLFRELRVITFVTSQDFLIYAGLEDEYIRYKKHPVRNVYHGTVGNFRHPQNETVYQK